MAVALLAVVKVRQRGLRFLESPHLVALWRGSLMPNGSWYAAAPTWCMRAAETRARADEMKEAASCANGEPNRVTFLEARHRPLERHYVGTRQPVADVRQHSSAPWWLMAQSGHHDRADPCLLLGVKRTLRGRTPMSAPQSGHRSGLS